MFQSGNMIGPQCCIFVSESLHFKTAKLLKLGVNYSWYHRAHAEPVTAIQCSRPRLNHRRCGRLKRTLWQHGYKLTRVCLYMGGLHIIQLKL